MATITRFEDLDIWKMARVQALEIYKLTQIGSFAKDFDLKNQINSSSGSCMDNIAEGFERFSNKEICQFLIVSKGSNGEIQSQLYRAFDRNHIHQETLNERQEFSKLIGKKIKSFIDYLKSTKFKVKPIKKPINEIP